ncbi:hypothetical protein MMC10_005587 [Thelotrema lepadinum]|nr:hypothetical protein [Thelotrema lepadinum]
MLGKADDDELRAVVEAYETSSDDAEIEIYIFVAYSIYKSLKTLDYLERGFDKAQTWVTKAIANREISSLDRGRRHRILAKLSSDIYETKGTLEGFLPIAMASLAKSLTQEYEQCGDKSKLDQAVQVMEKAVEVTDPAYLPHMYADFGVILSRQFQHTGLDIDLDRAIEFTAKAVDTTPIGHSAKANQLTNLGSLLGILFERNGLTEVLNHAIGILEEAVEATLQNDPAQASRLDNLGHALTLRFERSGSPDDLHRALENAGQAAQASASDNPRRAEILANLARTLGRQSQRNGEIEHLNDAIEILDREIAAISLRPLQKARLFHSLAAWLNDRFDRTGASEDLDRAIEMNEQSLSLLPAGHNDRIMFLSSLGNRLASRSFRRWSKKELTRAIECIQEVLTLLPSDHAERAGQLHNLGIMVGRRFEHGQPTEIKFLDQAVEACAEAVRILPSDHPNQAMFQINLATKLGDRAKQTGSKEDLENALRLAQTALEALPKDHPDRAVLLYHHGVYLAHMADQNGSIEELEISISTFEEGWKCHFSLPSDRIPCAWYASSFLARQGRWQHAIDILQAAVELLPILSPRALRHVDKQFALKAYDGMAACAASMSLNAGKRPYDALRLLEIGRGVIAGLLLEMRGDLSSLQQECPDLATEFITLRDTLDNNGEDSVLLRFDAESKSKEESSKKRREADKRLSELIEEIRTKHGFSGFLLPPTEEEMIRLADPDPIVITNISHFRCDAFLIDHKGIRVLEFPDLKRIEIHEQVKNLRTLRATSAYNMAPMLEWLWEALAKPCLDALGFKSAVTDENWPHIWWIPTGQLTYLPFHAAARQARGTKEAVLDRVISSYSLTLKAMLYGRRQKQPNLSPPPHSASKALLVAMPETPTYPRLPWASDEVSMLQGLCPSLHLQPLVPAALSRTEILTAIRSCKLFHFAGHGRTDATEPAHSSLLLPDWQSRALTMGDLRDCRLQDSGTPFLGYLSACSTGATEVVKLADEGVNLVGACQLAGFRHVVGTLWEVSDRCCVDVARGVYERLRDEGMTDRAVYRGLHFAVRALRDAEAEKGPSRGEAGDEFDGGGIAAEEDGGGGVEKRDGGKLTSTAKRRRATISPLWIPYVHYGV